MALFDKRNLRAARLTSDKVMEMRQLYEDGATQRELGEHFGVSTVQVGRIVRGESWRGSASLRGGRDPNLLVSPEALDASAQRLLYEQELYNAKQAIEGERAPPPSPLDGAEPDAAPLDVSELIKEKARAFGIEPGMRMLEELKREG